MKEISIVLAILVVISMKSYSGIMGIVEPLEVSEEVKNKIQEKVSNWHRCVLISSAIIVLMLFLNKVLLS